ncbi:MAG: hypothetical protein ABIY55_19190 [Kofleriaceae bacterium]
MPATIKLSEVTVHDPVRVHFGVTGLELKHAQSVMRDKVRDAWPEQKRRAQSVYVIRLAGEVAVKYPNDFSPVIYVGEGNAYDRLYNHMASWIAPLLLSVPQLSLEIRIVEVARRNHETLYQHIEADVLRFFSNRHGALPWFNRQWEPSKENHYEYEEDVTSELRKMIGVGSGFAYLWAIQPTHNNDQYEAYAKGIVK